MQYVNLLLSLNYEIFLKVGQSEEKGQVSARVLTEQH